MSSDPLSDVLELVDARCRMSGGLVAGGDWAVRFERPDAIKIVAIGEGGCWLVLEGDAPPTRLAAGDVVVLHGARGFVFASDPSRVPEDAATAFGGEIRGTAHVGQGRDFAMFGGHVDVDRVRGDLLLAALPSLLHVRDADAEAPVLRWLLERLVREMDDARPGATLAAAQIAQLIFVQALRVHVETAGPLSGGWLRGLADERVARALHLMHGDVSHPWTLEGLAREVALSRTAFALRFKTAVGVAPLAYLLAWRMRLAERDLRSTARGVATIAYGLGYGSESAFSNAFKRAYGLAPARYRAALAAERAGGAEPG